MFLSSEQDKRGFEMDKALTKVQNLNGLETAHLSIIEADLISIGDYLKEYITKTRNYLADVAKIKIPVPNENPITSGLYKIVQSIIMNNFVFLSDLSCFLDKKPVIKPNITVVTKQGEDHPLEPIINFMGVFGISYNSLVDKYREYFGKMEEYEKYLINKEMKVENGDKNKEEKFLKAIAEAKKNYLDQLKDTTKLAKETFECGFKFEDDLLGKYMEFFNKLFEEEDNKLKRLVKEYQDMRETFKILKENVNFERQKRINDLNNIYRKYPLLSLHEYVSKRGAQNKSNTNDKPKIYKNISLFNIENIKKEMESKGLEIDYEQLKDEKMNLYFEDKFKLFYGEEAVKDEIKNEIINYLKQDEDNIIIFYYVINRNRVGENAKFINEDNLIFLTDIFDMIFDFAHRKGDIEKLDSLMVLIVSYYIIKEGKNIFADVYFKKKYLEKHKELFTNPYFWEDYLSRLIQSKVQDKKNKPAIAANKDKFIQEQTFSNALSILHQIKNYDLDNNLAARFINLLELHGRITKEKSSQMKAMYEIKENN